MAKQKFGGDWTQNKLARVRKYLEAYMEIMKLRPYTVAYLDAFAGTGYVELEQKQPKMLHFPELAETETRQFIDGSARIALQIKHPFHEYHFVELSPRRCDDLEQLKTTYPHLQKSIRVHTSEANEFLRDFCTSRDWSKNRAVIFLDPYGMQVKWETIELIAKTKAIDMWYLFPLGVAVGRLLTKDGQIPPEWQNALNKLFGTNDWSEAFYQTKIENTLFGESESTQKIGDADAIAAYFVKRLKSIFAGVVEKPLPLYNRNNVPLYLLCFATANPAAVQPALRIANHLLKP